MKQYLKSDWRLAEMVARQLASDRRRSVSTGTLPVSTWNSLCEAVRRAERARSLGWERAAAALVPEIDFASKNLILLVEDFRLGIAGLSSKGAALTPDLFRDFKALRDEFEDVQLDRESDELAVTTEAIDLGGVDFGRFEIRLNLATPREYRVVALDPNPAATKPHVTHPHVSDESLCEGDGSNAIRLALAGGRLLDFFMLVSRILGTYSRGQAYVEIDAWHGATCNDCGVEMDDEDSRWCDRCSESICCDCTNYCAACENSICNGCDSPCSACGSSCCRACAENCDQCQKTTCSGCLQEGLCPQCHENQCEEETSESVLQAAAPLQSDGVGKAALPTGLGTD